MEKSQRHKPHVGLPPGTLRYVGENKTSQVNIHIIDYSGESYKEIHVDDVRETYDYRDKETISWLNVDGVHDVQVIKTLGLFFGLHPLLLEDVVDTGQRPKVDFYEKNKFVVLQMLSFNNKTRKVEIEQVNLVQGASFVISFQEDKVGDVFNPIRQRLKQNPNGKLRHANASYLFYRLIDAIVDNYFIVQENLEGILEVLEEKIIKQDLTNDPTRELYSIKQQFIKLRKALRPLREIINHLIREEDDRSQNQEFYLRDLLDHVIQLSESTESAIETCASLMDLYLSIIGNKTNDVMKVLTIFSTIFLPLTFVVGVYGMNFQYIPETQLHYGYFIIWGVMISMAIGTYFYFKRKHWI